MSDLKSLTKAELAEQLESSLSMLVDSNEKATLQKLAHDLQIHQIELEMQNRELRDSQRQLEEARDLYSDLYDFAPLSYITLDSKGVIKKINLTGADMLGQLRSRIVDQPFSRWVEKSFIRDYFNHLHKTLESDVKLTDEIEIKGRNGRLLVVQMESVRSRDEVNNTFMCRSAIIDITENNRIKNESLRNERQLRLVTDALPALVAYINRQETHIFANKAYTDWFGYLPAEIIGKDVSEIWRMADYRKVDNYIKDSLLGSQVNTEIQFQSDGGEYKYFNVIIVPDHDDNNLVCGVIILMRDITDRIAAESDDRQRLLDVAHISRLSSMGEMVGEIAHELNQPLAAISVNSHACRRMIISGKGTQDLIMRTLEEINGLASRAGEIIRRIREFVGKKTLDKEKISINMVVQEALNLLAIEIRTRNVKLEMMLDNDLPMVYADKILIEQVIFNLARNSLEAMDGINVTQRLLKIQTSKVSSSKVEISVEDSGPGLPLNEIDNIFKPFYTTKSTGMGMGLAISQSIVNAHGGRLWLISNGHAGLTMKFTLPSVADGEACET